MELNWRLRILIFLAASCLIASACSTAPPSKGNQATANTNRAASPANSNSPAAASAAKDQSTSGSIEVTSTPPGAKVLLVSTGEGGAGEPQSKGLTPTTISGLAPGKYTVDLEKPGFRFFQKEIEVKAGSTVKVAAALKKQ